MAVFLIFILFASHTLIFEKQLCFAMSCYRKCLRGYANLIFVEGNYNFVIDHYLQRMLRVLCFEVILSVLVATV